MESRQVLIDVPTAAPATASEKLARYHRQRRPPETDRGRSAFAVGTPLHAPLRPF